MEGTAFSQQDLQFKVSRYVFIPEKQHKQIAPSGKWGCMWGLVHTLWWEQTHRTAESRVMCAE